MHRIEEREDILSEQIETVEGYVEKIVFRNAENGYTVLRDGSAATHIEKGLAL